MDKEDVVYTHTHTHTRRDKIGLLWEKGGIMGLHDIMCETFENCKELQNLKNLTFNKRKKKCTHSHKPGK